MRKTSLFTRSLAALLCFVMVLGMLPVFGMAPVAYAAEGDETTDDTTEGGENTGTNSGQQTNITGDYITLPITIRDFAADGMLFEFNELNESTFTRDDDGTITWGTPTTYTKTDRLYTYDEAPYTAVYNPTAANLSSNSNTLIYVQDAATTTLGSGYDWWYCLITDASGNILKVLPAGTSKATFEADMAATYTLPGGTAATPAYSVWAWRGAANVPYYSVLAKVTEDNKDQYQFGFYDTTSSTLTAGDTGYFYLGQKYNTTADHQSFYVTTGNNITISSYENWKRIVCDSDGQIVAVIPVGNTDDYSTYQASDYTIVMYSKWNSTTEDTTSHITTANMSEYQIVTPTCDVGGALFIERTIQVNEANTKGFGLLYTLASDYLHWLDTTNEAENLPNTTYYEYNYNYTTMPYEVALWDQTPTGQTPVEYAAQDLYGAGIRTNLVTKKLDPITGKPLYTETTVAFLAKYMEQIMAVPEIGDNGAYNMHHVMGVKLYDEAKQYVGPNSPLAVYDLADIFRLNVTGGLGDYDTARAKFDSRGLLYPHQATTWYEAAYYLLHMLWNDSPVDERTGTEGQDGYGMPITNYNRIHLVKTTNENGDECYVFNAKYDGTTYDYKNGEIFNSHFAETENTETREYTVAYTRAGAEDGAYSNPMPANRFDPLGPSGAGVNRGYTMSGDTYGDFAHDSDMVRSEYYDETNYNLTLEGHAQFVYHEDSNQYFTFTGDDDVYLYINGIRVLDVGGAHSISKVSINLNDVAAEIGLSDGGTYRFDFFYTERHGTAANFGIETNIQIADASMNTAKTGYQGGTNTGYGGPVNKDTHVGYSFELQNDGSAHIYNLVFQDDDIGVYFGYDRLQYYPTTYPEGVPEEKQGANLYTINDLYLIYYNSAGQITEFITPGSLTETSLMKYLDDGLEPGEKIGIYGFKYYIPESQWVTNYVLDANGNPTTEVEDISFTNHVYTFANTDPDGEGTPLHGVADWKVVQMEVPYEPFHVYDWVHKDVPNALETEADTPWEAQSVTVDWTKLDDYLADEIANNNITQEQLANAKVVRCTGSGNEEEHNQNTCVSTDGRSITYTSATTGKDTVFFKFKDIEEKYNDLVFSYEVYTYGVGDNVYVLDYGLPVELAGANFGFQNNDVLTNNFNNNPVRITATVVDSTSNYGTFTHTSAVNAAGDTSISSLKYTPNKIIDNIDKVQVKIKIVETETENEVTSEKELTRYTGVEMIQEITTAPANVVYYEDTFPGLTFVDGAWGNWASYETKVPKKDASGNVLKDASGNIIYEEIAGIEQSADPDLNYGEDPSYKNDKEGVLVGNNGQIGTEEDELSSSLEFADLDKRNQETIDAINDYLGNRGGDSNGTVKELVINTTKQTEAMYFTFVGTGVEIIGRTTDDAFAVINVVVQKKNGDEWVNYRMKPVITQSIGGDQYQVPIISFTGLPKAEYRVSLKVAKSEGTTVERMLYIDGVRIYGPLGDEEALEYYNPEEYKAEFCEVKQLIQDGDVIFCAASDTGNKFQALTGGVYVENTGEDEEEDGVLVYEDKTSEYLVIGPNNELYLNGVSKTAVIAFFMTETPDYIDGARTLQIGAHRKADSENLDSTAPVYLVYGSLEAKVTNAKAGDANFYSVDTGTEMYYDIDVNELSYDEKLGGWIVMIGTNGTGQDADDMLALTNLKVAGYEISSVVEALKNAEQSGTNPTSLPIINEPLAVLKAWVTAANQGPELGDLLVNENLAIASVKLTEEEVASGKSAKLTVKASANADSIVIYDADGNEVELTRCKVKSKNGQIVFDVAFSVNGERGEKQTFTIRVFDSEKLASVNAETITVTIV